jgi:hypothetical protein
VARAMYGIKSITITSKPTATAGPVLVVRA